MSEAYEINFDGLIGPSHNYGGLSDGNLAATKNEGQVSHPREAALQGLEKMRAMLRAGLKQGVLPPLPRPCWDLFDAIGIDDAAEVVIPEIAKAAPRLLKVGYSASAMWTANAATVSPSADASDDRVHLTVANLSTMLHRSLEHPDTLKSLRAIFRDPRIFTIHEALPGHADFSDEGAANHMRLCAGHGAPGVEVFVHGREAGESVAGFPARQSRLASESVARLHRLAPERTVHIRQSRTAIEAGAFHNDVVAVACLDTLFAHEHAFEDREGAEAAIRKAAGDLFEPKFVTVPEADVALPDAIKSYLFNSQLLKFPGEDRLVLVAPMEAKETETTRAYCEALVAGNGPIGRVDFVDVRQSMRNGGGPACLRLRVVLTEKQLEGVHPGALLDEAKIDALQDAVRATYRETLSPADLADPAFAEECFEAREALLKVLDIWP